MSFFTSDQEGALYAFLRQHAQYDDILTFLKGTLASFLAERVAPKAFVNDRDEVFDVDNFHQLGELGFMSLSYPEAYGGLGAPFPFYCAGLESLAKADAGFALGVAIHGTMCDGIHRFANEDVKKRFLADLISGRKIGAFALSEANSGSDARAMATRFTVDEKAGQYVLNGTKYWITNGMSAEVFFVLARGKDDRISAFVVEKGGAGTFRQAKIADKMGVRGSNTAELVFEDYRIPKANLVGTLGDGFKYAMQMLAGGRVTISAWATGIAQGAYEKFLKYAGERSLFGKKLRDLDNTGRELSEMLIEIQASRLLAQNAAFWKSENRDITQVAALAKVHATETSVHVAERAIELAGGYGYVQDSRIERHLRDALLGRIGEGANEVLKVVVIARRILADFDADPVTEVW